ncbi:MAG TPA: hypothetical protein VH796_08200 [Nitrososphaeraceae archaeon]
MLKIGKRIDLSLRILPVVSIFMLAFLSAIFFLPWSWYESNLCNQCWHAAYAQSSGNPSSMNENNVTQMWTDRTSGISINLAYSPTKPIVDAPTNLKFIVRNVTGGNNLKDLTAHVSIISNSSGQERTFKYSNITAPTGDFALKYIFPDYGTYQVIATVRSNTSAVALASFPINIPVQVAGTFLSPTMIIGIVIIIVGVVALVIAVMKIKR